MIPQEKAKDLFDSYYYCLLQSNIEKRSYWSKQSAIIAVDEILEVIIFNKYDDKYWEEEEYWKEVKQELERL